MDRHFEMPSVSEPPRDPATPRPIDEARKQREDRAEAQREQDIRAQAINAATRISVPESDMFWGNVAAIHAYIKDGTHPA